MDQPKSVEEHFKLIVNDNTPISDEIVKMGMKDLPDWFDVELFERGQRYYASNKLCFGVASLVGLVGVLAIPSILEILMFTKKSSTPLTAFKRYLETILHVIAMYEGDVKNEDSKLYKSLNVIQWRHTLGSRHSKQAGFSPIVQRDMVLTQMAFIGFILVCPDKLPLTNSPDERRGVNHFWRVVGHLLGIPLRLNVCREDEAETTQLCRKIINELYRKNFEKKSTDFTCMSRVTLQGLQCVDPMLNIDAFMVHTYELHGLVYPTPLSLTSKFCCKLRNLNYALFRIPLIGTIVRSNYNVLAKLMLWVIERYPVIAWIRWGKDNCKINLYPNIVYSN